MSSEQSKAILDYLSSIRGSKHTKSTKKSKSKKTTKTTKKPVINMLSPNIQPRKTYSSIGGYTTGHPTTLSTHIQSPFANTPLGYIQIGISSTNPMIQHPYAGGFAQAPTYNPHISKVEDLTRKIVKGDTKKSELTRKIDKSELEKSNLLSKLRKESFKRDEISRKADITEHEKIELRRKIDELRNPVKTQRILQSPKLGSIRSVSVIKQRTFPRSPSVIKQKTIKVSPRIEPFRSPSMPSLLSLDSSQLLEPQPLPKVPYQRTYISPEEGVGIDQMLAEVNLHPPPYEPPKSRHQREKEQEKRGGESTRRHRKKVQKTRGEMKKILEGEKEEFAEKIADIPKSERQQVWDDLGIDPPQFADRIP